MKLEDAITEYCQKLGAGIMPTDEQGYWNINIQFINSDGNEDETQFDVKPYRFDYGIGKCAELVELWREFCKENRFAQNSVLSISFGTCN